MAAPKGKGGLTLAQARLLKDIHDQPQYSSQWGRTLRILRDGGFVESFIRPASGDRINDFWRATEAGAAWLKENQ